MSGPNNPKLSTIDADLKTDHPFAKVQMMSNRKDKKKQTKKTILARPKYRFMFNT